MKQITHYLETGSTDPFYNLAFEEYVLTHRQEGDYLLLWQNNNAIVIGQNQNTEAEINRAFVEAHKIHVVRRSTGGGAVYHDLGNLNYSFITDEENAEQITIKHFTEPVVRALKGLELDAESSGRNDILVDGRKVSGTAQRLKEGRILHHGTLLFDSNLEMVAGALNVDPEKFRSKGTKSVRSRIGNIHPCLPHDMTLPEFWTYLKTALAGGGLTMERLSPGELAAVETLKREKYDTWEWNFGRSPKYDMRNKRYWDGGMLEAAAAVEKGRITSLHFWGDFLAVDSMEPVLQELRECRFEREQVRDVLRRFPLTRYFGAITEEEILETLFGF